MEKNFLQSIKLEISRNFKLVPYERMAFHKILGILKTETGMEILRRELEKGPEIRESAVSVLSGFDHPSATEALTPCLSRPLGSNEQVFILDHLIRNSSAADPAAIIAFLTSLDPETTPRQVTARAFRLLHAVGAGSGEVLDYLLSIIASEEADLFMRCRAILALSAFPVISRFEEILKGSNDTLCCYVYRAIDEMNTRINRPVPGEEDSLYTYTRGVEEEDKVILDIRVLMGKMTPRFDGYSTATKVAFINAMMSCNHREYLIYVKKALTSVKPDLITMTLYGIYRSITRLKDPDKLFRSLIALSTESERDNELIVEIFVKFFTSAGDERKYHILKDKTYSNIVVTLETYFETYRREFMIRDVMEKGFPESFQNIRKFILEKMTPELRKRITGFLTIEESRGAPRLLEELSSWVTFVSESEEELLKSFVEILFDSDHKSRENSASRIEDINFEKRYLRNRIIRLCMIISRLGINDAASPLVNIYNYLKKYPDRHIIDTAIQTLADLNYSYMLGEIEVLLSNGTEEEQIKALKLISLYTEQRSMNILFEYLQNRLERENECVAMCLEILIEHDITGNATANQLFKKVLEVNRNENIRCLAVLGIGLCGSDADMEFLNGLFFSTGETGVKEAIVRSIGRISMVNPDLKKRQVSKYLQEYLKDAGIRVRIYSCLFLVRLGDMEALRSIREMLVIKNKSIQRDILTILGDIRSLEFSFFLISLLKEEYGMTDDIIAVLRLLPEADLKEIDAFIINIFRKFEAPELGELSSPAIEKQRPIPVENMRKEDMTVLHMRLHSRGRKSESYALTDLISVNIRIKSFIYEAIKSQDGIISLITGGEVLSFFHDPVRAVNASLAVAASIRRFNQSRARDHRIRIGSQIITASVSRLKEDIINFPAYAIETSGDLPLEDRIIIDGASNDSIRSVFAARLISEMNFSDTVSVNSHYEIQNPVNFFSWLTPTLKSFRPNRKAGSRRRPGWRRR